MTLRAVPDTHWEKLMVLARQEFDDGNWSKGLANVVHASYVEERPDEPTRLRLVRDVLGVSWSPNDAA